MKVFFYLTLVFSLLISKFAFALDCYAMIDNEYKTSEIKKVNDIILPESAKNGDIIWISPLYTRQVMCDKAGIKENVYFYPFPNVDYHSIPAGMSFGLIYNGNDYPLTSSTSKIVTDILVPKGGSQTGTINVQVYIKKVGDILGGFEGNLDIYQLDGVGSLQNLDKNFRFSLSNLGNIATGKCSYSLSGVSGKNEISINDDLISRGRIITAVGTASVSCTPINLLKNRIVKMDLYTNISSSDSLFKTDKNGLGYQLLMSGDVISPSVTSSSPLILSYSLDGSAKGTKSFDQKVFLTSINEDWIYQNDTTIVQSNNPNLEMRVNTFE